MAKEMSANHSVRDLPVVVTVIEAGALEHQVCLLAESIRRWGGRFSSVHMVAVKPRWGPDISGGTRQELKRLGVEYVQIARDDGMNWFPYLNKTAAIRHVAARDKSVIVWLDADILVVGEPTDLMLDVGGHDAPGFAACASDKNIGTSRDDDESAPYFQAACRALGVDYESLPYVITETEKVPVRAYWNSGVYAFAQSSGLADVHHNFTAALVSKRIASHVSKLFFSDQISLGLAAHFLGLKSRNLALTYNFHVQPNDPGDLLHAAGFSLRILHYHGCLWPSAFQRFCGRLDANFPEVSDWLRQRGPLSNSRVSWPSRLCRKSLSIYRKRQQTYALRGASFY